jgi:hypothetical protein
VADTTPAPEKIEKALAAAEQALMPTTSGGIWTTNARDGEGRTVRHEPSRDSIATFRYPGDARHAVRYQPRRIAELIASDRILLTYATDLAATGEPNSAMIGVALLQHLTARWVTT